MTIFSKKIKTFFLFKTVFIQYILILFLFLTYPPLFPDHPTFLPTQFFFFLYFLTFSLSLSLLKNKPTKTHKIENQNKQKTIRKNVKQNKVKQKAYKQQQQNHIEFFMCLPKL